MLGVILAGGRSARFGADKALALLRGRPLALHVAERLSPQVDRAVLNANGDPNLYAPLGLPIFADAGADRDGPLAGVLAGLAYAAAHGFDDVVTVPCDAPALPADLVARLRAGQGDALCAFADVNGVANPVFALYRVSARPAIAQAFADGVRAPRHLAERLDAARAAFTAHEARAFHDIDSRDDLAAVQSGFLAVR